MIDQLESRVTPGEGRVGHCLKMMTASRQLNQLRCREEVHDGLQLHVGERVEGWGERLRHQVKCWGMRQGGGVVDEGRKQLQWATKGTSNREGI